MVFCANMRTARSITQVWARLGTGFVLNLPLWPMIQAVAKWSGYDRETELIFAIASLGVAAMVVTIPVFWRGLPWQAPIAFVLLWLPGWAIYLTVGFVIDHWRALSP